MDQNLAWLSSPKPDHLVHFYPLDSELVSSLLEYVGSGLEKGETCIVIATPRNLINLNKALRKRGIDIGAVMDSNQYITHDAEVLLNSFMLNGSPDLDRFLKGIGNIISLASGRNKPIRAFGEMVALLLKKGNLEGVIQLEKYWNNLMADNAFSLYCAYPETDFSDTQMYKKLINKICTCHTLAAGSPA